MNEALKALDYLEDRIGRILRNEPVRDLDEAILALRSLIAAPGPAGDVEKETSEATEKREPRFWGDGEDEHLTHRTEDEAIEAILDAVDELPETITIVGFAPMIPSWEFITPLSDLLESLDDDGFGGENVSEPTKAMEEAEAVFMAVVKAEYVAYSCEEVTRKEIDVGEWIKTHRPGWLKSAEVG